MECKPGGRAVRCVPSGQLCGQVRWSATAAIDINQGAAPFHVTITSGTLNGGGVCTEAEVKVTRALVADLPLFAFLRVLVRAQRAWSAHWRRSAEDRRRADQASQLQEAAEAALLARDYSLAESITGLLITPSKR